MPCHRHTWSGAGLVVGISGLESLVNVLLPVAHASASVHASGSVLNLGGGSGLDNGEVSDAGDRADGEENERFELFGKIRC